MTLGSEVFGTALPVDPGKHTVTVTAPGRAAKSYELTLVESERKTLDVEPGAPTESTAEAKALVAPTNMPAPGSGREATPAPGNGAGQRTLAYVLGGVGIAGIAVGTYFGLETYSKWSDAKNHCGGGCDPGSQGQNDRSDALTDGTLSTVGFALGGAAIAAAALLYFTAHGAPDAAPRGTGPRVRVTAAADRGRGGVLLWGTW